MKRNAHRLLGKTIGNIYFFMLNGILNDGVLIGIFLGIGSALFLNATRYELTLNYKALTHPAVFLIAFIGVAISIFRASVKYGWFNELRAGVAFAIAMLLTFLSTNEMSITGRAVDDWLFVASMFVYVMARVVIRLILKCH